MNGRVLLDTNIVIALFRRDSKVHRHLAETTEVFMASIVLGELFYGAYRSTNVQANIARIRELAERSTVLVCDSTTAQHYGHIKSALRGEGHPIPENDIWIAALCEQYKLSIATRDEHLKHVHGITVEIW